VLAIRDTTKPRRGRPKTTGRGRQIGVRWHPTQIKKIEAWGAKKEDEPSRAEAIRRLVALGLQVNQQKTGGEDQSWPHTQEMK
jgi:hypothetical protein